MTGPGFWEMKTQHAHRQMEWQRKESMRRAPIRTVYIGTVAFQGTDAEISAMIKRAFGGVA